MQELTQRIADMEQQLTINERLYYQSLLEQTIFSPDSIKKMRRGNIENTAITTMLMGVSGLLVIYIILGRIQETAYSQELVNLAAYGIPIATAAVGAISAWARNKIGSQKQIDTAKLDTLYAVKNLLDNSLLNEVDKTVH